MATPGGLVAARPLFRPLVDHKSRQQRTGQHSRPRQKGTEMKCARGDLRLPWILRVGRCVVRGGGFVGCLRRNTGDLRRHCNGQGQACPHPRPRVKCRHRRDGGLEQGRRFRPPRNRWKYRQRLAIECRLQRLDQHPPPGPRLFQTGRNRARGGRMGGPQCLRFCHQTAGERDNPFVDRLRISLGLLDREGAQCCGLGEAGDPRQQRLQGPPPKLGGRPPNRERGIGRIDVGAAPDLAYLGDEGCMGGGKPGCGVVQRVGERRGAVAQRCYRAGDEARSPSPRRAAPRETRPH